MISVADDVECNILEDNNPFILNLTVEPDNTV
jgi:hypothetical protein